MAERSFPPAHVNQNSASSAFLRSVTTMQPGACVMQIGGLAWSSRAGYWEQ
jgi:hypothetical protein